MRGNHAPAACLLLLASAGSPAPSLFFAPCPPPPTAHSSLPLVTGVLPHESYRLFGCDSIRVWCTRVFYIKDYCTIFITNNCKPIFVEKLYNLPKFEYWELNLKFFQSTVGCEVFQRSQNLTVILSSRAIVFKVLPTDFLQSQHRMALCGGGTWSTLLFTSFSSAKV